jgi:AmmeMemoRadiSam system protein A
MSRPLNQDEKRWLLVLARSTLAAALTGRPLPSPPVPEGPLTEPRGAFVTLKKNGALRGCIGYVVGHEPLWKAVQENAVNAALRDPRFPPVTAEELPGLEIEISALTPLVKVTDPAEIVVGRDGLMMERGPARGLLLPQVPVEYGWDRGAFLDQTCRKAGMEPGCWRDPRTRIWRFEAEVFAEGEL